MRLERLLLGAWLLVAAAAAAQDSTAYFRALLEHMRPSVADIGGLVAPEIVAVNHYPLFPSPGEGVRVRATVMTYRSMVPYRIKEVKLTYWRHGETKRAEVEMKPEEVEQGVYAARIPQGSEGDEVFYAVSATDDWGNKAVEMPPDTPLSVLLRDPQDATLPGPLDILSLQGGRDALLRLCLELRERPKRAIKNEKGRSEAALYGLAVMDRDVRYKPYATEGELTSGWLAGYVPQLRLEGMFRMADLLAALTSGPKEPSPAEFEMAEATLCFRFDPALVREDAEMGLKVGAVTVTAGLPDFTLKPKDATPMLVLYPVLRSYTVRKL